MRRHDNSVAGWALNDEAKSISRTFVFKNSAEALRFINTIGALAEKEGPHPDIHWQWNTVTLELAPTNNAFILAAKINQI